MNEPHPNSQIRAVVLPALIANVNVTSVNHQPKEALRSLATDHPSWRDAGMPPTRPGGRGPSARAASPSRMF